VFTKMGCMLSADGSGGDLLRIQGLEEVAFGFEYSDRHRNAKTGEIQGAIQVRYRRRQAQIPMIQRTTLMRTWDSKS